MLNHAPLKNHGVTTPFRDHVFGTYVEADTVRIPRRMALRWMIDDHGEVLPEYRDTYELRGTRPLDDDQRAQDRELAFANQAPTLQTAGPATLSAMGLRVVGSGLGRTGTKSLKAALELLLDAPCYHMFECFQRPDDPARWTAAMRGEDVDWDDLLDGFAATVDWPAAACWKELAAAYPDAVILHSERPADEWFRSADQTIFEMFKKAREQWDEPGTNAWWDMAITMFEDRFTPDFLDPEAAMAAVDAWNADVRASAPADRLLIWQTGDGWEPICAALGLPVPEAPFPHTNTTQEFRERAGFDS